ncbi:MAG: tRNA preQ1(34) S-adenosylmethionine ribosyltransferase-isomerase QueA [Verrucomicrobiota bacterium]
MKTAEFDYELPQQLIAQHPLPERDQARMLVVHRRGGTLEHRRFIDFAGYLEPRDLLVVNNTRVIPARVMGQKADTGGRVELLLLEEIRPGTWDVLLHASRRPKPGSLLTLGSGHAAAVLLEEGERGRATVRILSERPWMEIMEEIGVPPLPPYIARQGAEPGQLAADRERYQTVYAENPGAVAAPTAGLHFTPAVLEWLERKNVRRAAVTLHVGLGTFRPVETEEVEDHHMEAERYEVSEPTARLVEDTRKNGGRIVAVGSTTARTLETVVKEHGHMAACHGRTTLFIHPPYSFKAVDVLLTNFHLPKSTLLMMVCAFGGRDLILRAYEEAVTEGYRFYSYGDCMLIL